MKDVLLEMEDLEQNGLDIDGTKVECEWFFCADWKFLATFLGMNAANSHYFCLWCLCNKIKIQDQNKPLGYSGKDRDFESCCSNSLKSTAEERKGS